VIEERKKEEKRHPKAMIKGKYREREREGGDPVCICVDISRPISLASERK
jgi:hypothetical protein